MLIQGPKPLNESVKSTENEERMLQSADLDQSFIEARGQGVIEENEVLSRGEWKRPLEEEEEEEEEEECEMHVCNYCGKPNVT